jgi:hypothetical protein
MRKLTMKPTTAIVDSLRSPLASPRMLSKMPGGPKRIGMTRKDTVPETIPAIASLPGPPSGI